MFNLDQAIAEWRRQMAAAGIKTPEIVDELEGHLREDVDEQLRSGVTAPEAFKAAIQRMGRTDSIKLEFDKAGGMIEQVRSHWFRTFGIAVGLLSGIYFLGLSSYGLLKHEMDADQRVLGLSALASMVVLSLGTYFLCRRFLHTAESPIKKSIAYGGAALWIGWMLCFFLVILPRCELEIDGLVVALLWTFVPGAVLVGASLGLGEVTSHKPVSD